MALIAAALTVWCVRVRACARTCACVRVGVMCVCWVRVWGREGGERGGCRVGCCGAAGLQARGSALAGQGCWPWATPCVQSLRLGRQGWVAATTPNSTWRTAPGSPPAQPAAPAARAGCPCWEVRHQVTAWTACLHTPCASHAPPPPVPPRPRAQAARAGARDVRQAGRGAGHPHAAQAGLAPAQPAHARRLAPVRVQGRVLHARRAARCGGGGIGGWRAWGMWA